MVAQQPDSRIPKPAGEGAMSQRNDLSRPPAPGLDTPGVQYGQVGQLQQGMQIAPVAGSRPRRASGRPSGRGASGPSQTSMRMPDPMMLAQKRLGGTLTGVDVPPQQQPVPGRYLSYVRGLAQSPGSPTLLTQAFLRAAHQAMYYQPRIQMFNMREIGNDAAR